MVCPWKISEKLRSFDPAGIDRLVWWTVFIGAWCDSNDIEELSGDLQETKKMMLMRMRFDEEDDACGRSVGELRRVHPAGTVRLVW